MSTSLKPAYHHGDLRAALVAEGLRLLDERPADDLSLRELARGVGVSATAVYRHFPDKAALMTALAVAGLDRLGEAQHAAFDAAGGGRAGFVATGVAYVRFAREHTAVFRLIFANSPIAHSAVAHSLVAEAQPLAEPSDAMRFLMANAASLTPPGMDARLFALQAWSVAHGLAMLVIDGQLDSDDATVEQVIGCMPF